MKIVKIIILITVLCSCKMPTNPSFDYEVKGLFFGADINGSYESNLEYLKTLKFLKPTEPEGLTVYPPLSALGQDGRDSSMLSFQFDNHPYKSLKLGRGTLNITRRGYDQQVLSDFAIHTLFKSKQNAEKVYQALVDKFSEMPLRKEKFQFPQLKYIEFYDSASNFPGLRISLENDGELNRNTLTLSVIR